MIRWTNLKRAKIVGFPWLINNFIIVEIVSYVPIGPSSYTSFGSAGHLLLNFVQALMLTNSS